MSAYGRRDEETIQFPHPHTGDSDDEDDDGDKHGSSSAKSGDISKWLPWIIIVLLLLWYNKEKIMGLFSSDSGESDPNNP